MLKCQKLLQSLSLFFTWGDVEPVMIISFFPCMYTCHPNFLVRESLLSTPLQSSPLLAERFLFHPSRGQ